MAQQTIALGSPTQSTALQITFGTRTNIASALLADSSVATRLEFLRFEVAPYGIFFRLDPSAEMSDAWERSPRAMTVTAGGSSWTFVGPNAVGALETDSTEPYSWRPMAGATDAFIAAFRALSSSDQAGAMLTLDDIPRPAPTVTLDAIPAGDEGEDVTLGATVGGGTFASTSYAWSVSAGALDDPTSATPVWTRPSVAAETQVTVTLRVTVTGDGTTAAAESVAVSATAQATVRNLTRTVSSTSNRVHVRVIVDSQDLSAYQGHDWIESVTWQQSAETPIGTAQVRLHTRRGTVDIAPSRGTLLNIGDVIRIETAVLTTSASPSGSDWTPVFEGLVDTIEWAGNFVNIDARDRFSARCADRWIERPATYGSEAGKPLDETIQDILTAWAPGITLWAPRRPGYRVRAFEQDRATVLDAINELAALAGWVIRQTFDSSTNAFRLTLLEPDRDRTITDFTFPTSGYLGIRRLQQSVDQVRNVVEVEWTDPDGDKHTETVTHQALVSLVGRRWLRIVATAQIDTQAEAQALAEAALADLATGDVEQTTEMRFVPDLDVGDRVEWAADGWHFTTSQTHAVVSVQHSIDGQGDRTMVTTRGRPTGPKAGWLIQDTAEDEAPDVSVTHEGVGRTSRLDIGGTTRTQEFQLEGVRANGGTLVWKRGTEAWMVVAAKTTANAKTDPVTIDALTGGRWRFVHQVPSRGGVTLVLTVAARTGAGTTEDPHVFWDEQSFTFSAEVPELKAEVQRVTSEPTSGEGLAEGTLLCLPVDAE